jgi:hypothetical protein
MDFVANFLTNLLPREHALMNTQLTVVTQPGNFSAPTKARAADFQRHAGVSPVTQLAHVSRLVYAVPVERARRFVPAPFDLDVRRVAGRDSALVTVESFLDCGSHGGAWLPHAPGGAQRREVFEQTNYRVHSRLGAEACGWLIGTSLGSLSAVAARHLWPAPWHLGAMEFQVSYDPLDGRYQHYRLRAQSQWASASWELGDTGLPVDRAAGGEAERARGGVQTDYFTRRDGTTGAYRVCEQPAYATQGEVRAAKCDLLARLGLLTAEELSHPYRITLQQRVTRTVEAASRPAAVDSQFI